jgi:hypothetical protein
MSNVARHIFSIVPPGVGVKGSFSFGEMLLAGESLKPLVRHLETKLELGSLLEPMTEYWRVIVQH